MKKKKFPTLTTGEWVCPKMNGYELQCCDCGLIHSFDFIILDNSGVPVNNCNVLFRAYRQRKKKWGKK